jgi:pyridoxal phosphate enzyme (YggS family)
VSRKNSSIEEFIRKNLAQVKREIKEACRAKGRSEEDVTLIAVSKGHDFSSIKIAYHLGQQNFGESYAVEMSQKMMLAKEEGLTDVRFHFIGAVQSNKLKLIKNADVVHSISSIRHAEMLNNVLVKNLPIFLQVNLNQDSSRQGFFYSEIISALEKIQRFSNLKPEGLMAILPQDNNPSLWFMKMSALKDDIVKKGMMDHVFLSMGMSDDFKEAISYGANYVRIGTRIFGARN